LFWNNQNQARSAYALMFARVRAVVIGRLFYGKRVAITRF
jgi:hypothetical protein